MQTTGLPRQFNGAAKRDALGRWRRARNAGLTAAQAADAIGVRRGAGSPSRADTQGDGPETSRPTGPVIWSSSTH